MSLGPISRFALAAAIVALAAGCATEKTRYGDE